MRLIPNHFLRNTVLKRYDPNGQLIQYQRHSAHRHVLQSLRLSSGSHRLQVKQELRPSVTDANPSSCSKSSLGDPKTSLITAFQPSKQQNVWKSLEPPALPPNLNLLSEDQPPADFSTLDLSAQETGASARVSIAPQITISIRLKNLYSCTGFELSEPTPLLQDQDVAAWHAQRLPAPLETPKPSSAFESCLGMCCKLDEAPERSNMLLPLEPPCLPSQLPEAEIQVRDHRGSKSPTSYTQYISSKHGLST